MTEAMRNLFRQPDVPASADAAMSAGERMRAANGATLRWTPGPDERRLPSCEDEPVPQNTRHLVAIVDCFDSLQRHWRGRRDVFVGADQFVYWDPAYDRRRNPAGSPAAPDVYVAFGVANRHRSSYVVWEEGKPPDFVLEIVSPSSRQEDEEEKPRKYAKMGVPEYFLYDPEGESEPALAGFELRAGGYEPLPVETLAGGVVGVRSKVLGMCLCVEPSGPEPLDGSLRWYDPATGEFLPTRHELADDNHRLADDNHRLVDEKRQAEARVEASEARAAESEARAEMSEAEAAESKARVAELEALIEKMRRG